VHGKSVAGSARKWREIAIGMDVLGQNSLEAIE
jgi:hypothetical protein